MKITLEKGTTKRLVFLTGLTRDGKEGIIQIELREGTGVGSAEESWSVVTSFFVNKDFLRGLCELD